MYLKKFLAQPNVVGTVLIVLLVGTGFVYAFAFDGFNIETATGGDVDVWVAEAGSGNCGGSGPYRCICSYRTGGKGLCDCSSSKTKPDNKPCGGEKASGCQSGCRKDDDRCLGDGECIRWVCRNSKLKGDRCIRHEKKSEYCPVRNAGRPKGRR